MSEEKVTRTKTPPVIMMLAGVFLVVLANMASQGAVGMYIAKYGTLLLSGDFNFNSALSSLGL